jgi:AraC-like DNA-binding protein
VDDKEYYKIYLQDERPSSPKPLYLGHITLRDSFDSTGNHPPKSYYLFGYSLAACGVFDDYGERSELPPGSAFLYKFPDRRRRFLLESGMPAWTLVYLEFEPGLLAAPIEEALAADGHVYSLAPDASSVRALLALRAKWFASRKEVSKNSAALTYRGDIVMDAVAGARLVYGILSEIRPRRELRPGGRDLVEAVFEYVNARVETPIDVSRMAVDLGVSRSHLARVFAARTGRSPHHYIVRAKIRRACQYLSEPGTRNKEIAARLGLDSEFYFYRMFKRVVGMTPRQFRLSARREEMLKGL